MEVIFIEIKHIEDPKKFLMERIANRKETRIDGSSKSFGFQCKDGSGFITKIEDGECHYRAAHLMLQHVRMYDDSMKGVKGLWKRFKRWIKAHC